MQGKSFIRHVFDILHGCFPITDHNSLKVSLLSDESLNRLGDQCIFPVMQHDAEFMPHTTDALALEVQRLDFWEGSQRRTSAE